MVAAELGRRQVSEGVMYFDFGVSYVKKYFSLFMFIIHLSYIDLFGFLSFLFIYFLSNLEQTELG